MVHKVFFGGLVSGCLSTDDIEGALLFLDDDFATVDQKATHVSALDLLLLSHGMFGST
jgi:hypothetical protein